MIPAPGREGHEFPGLLEPHPRFADAGADAAQPDAGHRLSRQSLRVLGAHGQDQFKIFAISQGMLQRRFPRGLRKGSGIRMNGNRLGVQDRSAAAFAQDVAKILAEPIADVDQGVQLERQKIGRWIERAVLLLQTPYDQLKARVLGSRYIQADDAARQREEGERSEAEGPAGRVPALAG